MKPVEVNYIWKYRKKAKMGQKRVAHLLNHSDHTQISKWESGEKVPTMKSLFKLAHILQVRPEALYMNLYLSCAKEVDERQKTLPHGSEKVEHDPLLHKTTWQESKNQYVSLQ